MKSLLLKLLMGAFVLGGLLVGPVHEVAAAPAKTHQKKSSAKSKSAVKKSSAKKRSSAKKSGARKSSKKRRTRRAHRGPRIAPPAKTIQAINFDKDAYVNDLTPEEIAELDKRKADDLLMSALGLLGVSYRYGGSNPSSGLDCSGFIQFIFRESMNINLPRTSAAMAKIGIEVAREDLLPGDLVFFGKRKPRVDHVGMYVGDGRFIHSPRTGKNIEIQNLNKGYYVTHYITARRVPSVAEAFSKRE